MGKVDQYAREGHVIFHDQQSQIAWTDQAAIIVDDQIIDEFLIVEPIGGLDNSNIPSRCRPTRSSPGPRGTGRLRPLRFHLAAK